MARGQCLMDAFLAAVFMSCMIAIWIMLLT